MLKLGILVLAFLALGCETAVAVNYRPCVVTSGSMDKWDLCDLADFGPFFAKDKDGIEWTVSVLRNMTCSNSIIAHSIDFKYAAACSKSLTSSTEYNVVGAYGINSPKAITWKSQAGTPGVLLRVQSVSTAYGYSNLYDTLNIIVNCDPNVRAGPSDISITSPDGPNVPYLFQLTHASGCGF